MNRWDTIVNHLSAAISGGADNLPAEASKDNVIIVYDAAIVIYLADGIVWSCLSVCTDAVSVSGCNIVRNDSWSGEVNMEWIVSLLSNYGVCDTLNITPLCVKLEFPTGREGNLLAFGIASTSSVTLRIPACKGIAAARKAVGAKRGLSIKAIALSLHRTLTAIRLKLHFSSRSGIRSASVAGVMKIRFTRERVFIDDSVLTFGGCNEASCISADSAARNGI